MMPTGYTADVQSGKITELEPFVMQLARGMGALVTMRDDPSDATIPERFEPSPYYAERLAASQAKVEKLRLMSDEDSQAEADAEFASRSEAEAAARARHDEQRQRYLNMIAKVEAWQGAPEGIKEFALQQLRESLQFDCREPFKYWLPVEQQTGAEWRQQALAEALRSLEYDRKANADEISRTEGRNAWLAQLRQSLK